MAFNVGPVYSTASQPGALEDRVQGPREGGMSMLVVCAWCRIQVGIHGRDDGRTSHTVCDTCLGRLIGSVSLARETRVLPSQGDRAPDFPTGPGDPPTCRVGVFDPSTSP